MQNFLGASSIHQLPKAGQTIITTGLGEANSKQESINTRYVALRNTLQELKANGESAIDDITAVKSDQQSMVSNLRNGHEEI